MLIRRLLLTLALLWVSLAHKDQKEEPEDFLSVEDEEDDVQDIFVPTKDWKVVKEGQHIPPGLHVRMDFQTGVNEAKLLDEEEGEEEGEEERCEQESEPDTKHLYGESDRRGVVNKRTKVFSAKDVSNLLKDINNDTVDLNNLPLLASSSPRSHNTGLSKESPTNQEKRQQETKPAHSKDLPVTLHRDVEKMLELSSVLANSTASVAELCQALEELEYFVHQMHNARDLNGIGGLVLVVRLLNHTHPDVKSWAARVIGSASQSNPPVQELALQYGSLPLLCRLLSLSQAELVQRRALFALSALLRGNIEQQINFITKYQGLNMLGETFGKRSLQVQLKAVVLLSDFLNNKLISSDSSQHHLQLPVLLYNAVLDSGWCDHVPVLIHSDELVVVEKGLLAMRALRGTCSFPAELTRLKELVWQLLEREGDGADVEYNNHLLEHCKSLLKYIRTQNSDL